MRRTLVPLVVVPPVSALAFVVAGVGPGEGWDDGTGCPDGRIYC